MRIISPTQMKSFEMTDMLESKREFLAREMKKAYVEFFPSRLM